jgi:hypothetical protein
VELLKSDFWALCESCSLLVVVSVCFRLGVPEGRVSCGELHLVGVCGATKERDDLFGDFRGGLVPSLCPVSGCLRLKVGSRGGA